MSTTWNREAEDKEYAKSTVKASSEHSPVHVKINAEIILLAFASTAKGLGLDAMDNMQQMPVQTVNLESLKKKPWRRAGADITDYFNYGFDDESWRIYCKKQTKLRAANTNVYGKSRIQKGRNRHGEELCSAYSLSGSSSMLSSRESSASINATEGRSGSSRRLEAHPRLSDKENSTQVITEMPSEEDRITSSHLAPPSNFSSLFAYIPALPFLYRRKLHSRSTNTALESGHTKECDGSSTSRSPFLSGVLPLIPQSMTSNAGVTNAAKAWESHIGQGKCDKDRGRSREHGHDENSKRGRDRGRESCSLQNSGEERMRHRDHNFDSGEKEWHRREGWKKPSCSRNRKRKSQKRHKHKKTKKNRKDKDTNKMLFSANEENQI